MCLVKMRNINKYYELEKSEALHALCDVNLEIDRGELVSIMGVSGSGKSTLLNIMGCMDSMSGGTYIFNGVNIKECGDKELSGIRNRHIGFVLQNLSLLPGRTVWENVSIPILLNSEKKTFNKEKDILPILESLGLEEKIDVQVQNLSGGQKQRVAIARAVANRPELLIADEPTAALDNTTAEMVMNIFTSLNKSIGCTVVIATHDLRVDQCCSRHIQIEDGRLTNF